MGNNAGYVCRTEQIRLMASGLRFIDRKLFPRLPVCARLLMYGFHLAQINSWARTQAYTVLAVSVCVCVSPGKGGGLGQ